MFYSAALGSCTLNFKTHVPASCLCKNSGARCGEVHAMPTNKALAKC